MSTVILEERETIAGSENERAENIVSDTNQFVTFMSGNEMFAVNMAPVQEIIRVPEIVRVPLAPSTLDGLANLRGKVLPIISLSRLFGFDEQKADDATRVLIVDVGQPLGFVVDRVTSVLGVEAHQVEDVGAISSTVDTNLLSGLIKNVAGHAMIMVLDFAKLIDREFAHISAVTKNSAMAATLSTQENREEEKAGDELQLVSFHVADQEYALAIEDVQEIVQIPETVIHVPRSEFHVLGIVNLRNRLLPLVSLRRMFGLPEMDLNEKCRIVVLAFENTSVGLVVDGVNEVLRVAKNSVEGMPALLAREGELADISAICRLEDGKRLVSIVTARNLFTHSAIKEALNTVQTIEQDAVQDAADQDEALDDDEQVVIFRLGREEFGVPIASVQEIVRVPEDLVRVPKAPHYVDGVINLRGTVLPVIDLRLRLGLEQLARNDRQRIMVFLIGALRTGFIVDQVAEVLKIPKMSIETSPQLSSQQGKLLSRMANLEKQKRMVQLLDPAHLVEDSERDELTAVTGETNDKTVDRG